MKKLMVMLCAGAVAAFAHGAAMTWGSGAISLPAGGGSAGAGDVTAYLFVIDSATYATYAAKTTGTALNEALWSAYGSNLSSADASKASVKKGNKADLVDPNTYFTAGGKGNDAYAAILYVTKDEDYYMGNIGHYTFEADVDYAVSGLATTLGGAGSGGGATAWTAVPEPTSGLLLLLGMAGLALKRKRA
jgi:hypothetical protein